MQKLGKTFIYKAYFFYHIGQILSFSIGFHIQKPIEVKPLYEYLFIIFPSLLKQ